MAAVQTSVAYDRRLLSELAASGPAGAARGGGGARGRPATAGYCSGGDSDSDYNASAHGVGGGHRGVVEFPRSQAALGALAL